MAEETEGELIAILDSLRPLVEEGVLEAAQELARAREWGVAVEILCAQLSEYDTEVPRALWVRLKRLGERMGLDESHWLGLEIAGSP